MQMTTTGTSLAEGLDQFLKSRKRCGLREDSIRWYAEKLGQKWGGFLQWTFGQYPQATTEDITTGVVRKFTSHLQDKGLSAGSINGYLRAIKALSHFLVEEELLLEKPKITFVKQDEKIPTILQLEDVRLMLKIPVGRKTDFVACRDFAMMLVLLETGIRVSELTRLQVQDFDVVESVIKVKGKNRRERCLPLLKDTRSALQSYMKMRLKFRPRPDSPLFVTRSGGLLTRGRVSRQLQKYRDKVGLTGSVSPHMWRRTCATTHNTAGSSLAEIQTLLGHKSPVTTMKYLRITEEDLRRVSEKVGIVDSVLHGCR